jgi:GNAT superfamily N-acetyltransferase
LNTLKGPKVKTTYHIRLSKSRPAIADLMPSDYGANTYLITRINVPPGYRHRGYGSALLGQIIDDADYEHATLILEICPGGGMTHTELATWYESRGFYKSDDPNFTGLYIREPNGTRHKREVVRHGVDP